MRAFKYISGILVILFSLYVFFFFGFALSAVGASGTNQSSGESTIFLAFLLSGLPFGLGCYLIYSAYKNKDGRNA